MFSHDVADSLTGFINPLGVKLTMQCVSYLRRAFEVHPGDRQSGDVHGNAPIQIQCTHNEKEASAYD